MLTPNKELLDSYTFLLKLINEAPLAKENPIMDGTSIVFKISDSNTVCDAVVEVRMPGWLKLNQTICDQSRLMMYLQNTSDVAIKLDYPDFILNGGLDLPWKVGLTMMMQDGRRLVGEVLMWQVSLTGKESMSTIAHEVAKIFSKCRFLVTNNANTDL